MMIFRWQLFMDAEAEDMMIFRWQLFMEGV